MSLAEVSRRAFRGRGGALAEPAGRLTAAAGALLLGGLAAAVADPGGVTLALTLTAAGIVLALFVLGPRFAAAIRRHPGLLLAAAMLVLVPFGVVVLGVGAAGLGASDGGWSVVRSLITLVVRLLPLALVVVAAIGGLVLLADSLQSSLALARRGRTPWERIVDAPAGRPPIRAWRGVAGLGLVLLAVVLGLGVIGAYADGSHAVALLLVLLVGVAALAVVAVPVVVAGLARADRAGIRAAREDERQRVAAHLHDSVLQTLALVQRRAHDPAAVARLARRQEHELRAWMAGEVELGSETLAGALRAVVAEAEDELAATVEVTILGDRPLDRRCEALIAAAREALRNAARHAPGSAIYLFAQAGLDGAEVFVRDEGPGFDLEQVATERRGVRDAIVGRMAAAGGRATIDSAPGEGTEVALQIGRAGETA